MMWLLQLLSFALGIYSDEVSLELFSCLFVWVFFLIVTVNY